MPLPRFHRLPEERRARFLDVATRHFAERGYDRASYNEIIAEMGISKTSAYLYFDGKEDLYATVLVGLEERLSAVLGPWRTVDSAEALWTRLDRQSRALASHLAKNPVDLALAHVALFEGKASVGRVWFRDLVRNGVALGVVRDDLDEALMVDATVAVFQALDRWALAKMKRGGKVPLDDAWSLLRGLWGGGPGR